MSAEPPSSARPAVSVVDEQRDEPVDVERWRALAEGVLEAEGVGVDVELSVLFVDRATITELNRRYLEGEGATDVLAFPIDEEPDDLDDAPAVRRPPRVLGDVVICPAVARENAPAHAGTYEDELALLLIHGILHLLGMDHFEDDERRAMQAREEWLLEELHRP